jgi:hypothetical protein
LLSETQNPINSLILEERRKASISKATGILSVAMGVDLFAILFYSQSPLKELETLAKGFVPNDVFFVLVILGGISAVFAGISLLKFEHFNTISFAVGCGFAIFFGITLALMRYSELSSTVLIGTNATIIAPIFLSVAVMFLSVYPSRK